MAQSDAGLCTYSAFSILLNNYWVVESINHNLLRPNRVAVNQTQHINTRCHPACRDAIYRVSRMDDPSRRINHLQRPFAIDEDLTVADEREIITVATS